MRTKFSPNLAEPGIAKANALLHSEKIRKRRTAKGAPGEAGSKEKIDFGEVIGCHVAERGGKKTETTWGMVHYAKDGKCHIVPELSDVY